MNALVTGATGFIGSHLVKELVREKHSVRALVLPGEDVSALETQGVTVWRGDLSKRESLRGICNGMDVVFHLAARVTDWARKNSSMTQFTPRRRTSSKRHQAMQRGLFI